MLCMPNVSQILVVGQLVWFLQAGQSYCHVEVFCSMALRPVVSGHSIPFCSLHTRLPSWAAEMLHCPSWGGRTLYLGQAHEFSSYLPWDLGLPREEEAALRSLIVSYLMSGCFSLSSLDENCQGRFPSWNPLLSPKLRPDTLTHSQQLWHPFLPSQVFHLLAMDPPGNLLNSWALAPSSTKWGYQQLVARLVPAGTHQWKYSGGQNIQRHP